MSDYYQACYAHPDTGWAVVNISSDTPKSLVEDFSLIERTNAGLSSNKTVPMGASENPSCMFEIYCRNDAVGLVRTQYSISDSQGRPISFSHGYIFTNAYEILKDPNNILRISSANFSDKRISDEEKAAIRSTPGELNRELIKRAVPDDIYGELILREPFGVEESLKTCGLDDNSYMKYMLAVYSHLLATNTDKNLYIKTDGSEKYAWNLMYLTYIAVPYSMRPLLNCSTLLHLEQHNSKMIFCYETPDGVPYINPVTGENNVMSDVVEKRIRDRNPFIEKIMEFIHKGNQKALYDAIETCLRIMGDTQLNTMQVINLSYSLLTKEHEKADRLPGIIYSWMVLPVSNSKNWESTAITFLNNAERLGIKFGDEVKSVMRNRLEGAVTEDFVTLVNKVL